jgi:hypothetical protein
MNGIPPGCAKLLADWTLGHLTGDQAVDWAVKALEAGFDSPSLRILAGLDVGRQVHLFEAEQYLEKSFAELDLEIPDRDLVLWNYANEIASEIASGRLDPELGIDEMHRKVVDPLGHPESLRAWCLLWEGNHPEDYRPLSAQERRIMIYRLANKFAMSLDSRLLEQEG